jgi:hypothetical protein
MFTELFLIAFLDLPAECTVCEATEEVYIISSHPSITDCKNAMERLEEVLPVDLHCMAETSDKVPM